ncbi:hypothetical protein F4561_006520 [Lipingzhangella halophila]|uniref:Histidine kinase/HSP90-like ATPase domain-containing protein n=1 Tax=Lipingzhangella halophila TaxID=1783352 RepID=A0A7W7W6D0_9ACTN|nr:ATP-binding protein [Lipingzhangella halophila]MBB4935626.1 hypothetical protein [Lipingzhangella halophila]
MAIVQLTISALPAHVRTARLMATAVARRAGIAESALDEVRLAVGEACSRAVEAHRVHCPDQPIQLELIDGTAKRPLTAGQGDPPIPATPPNGHKAQRFEVVVSDRAPAKEASSALNSHSPDSASAYLEEAEEMLPGDVAGLSPDVGLAVIVGLADDVSIEPHEGGTVVRMSWPLGNTDADPESPLSVS